MRRSRKRRAGFVIRYMPATSVFERIAGDEQVQSGTTFSLSKRPIWLLRGQDRSGRNDFSIGHGQSYERCRGFLTKSKAGPAWSRRRDPRA